MAKDHDVEKLKDKIDNYIRILTNDFLSLNSLENLSEIRKVQNEIFIKILGFLRSVSAERDSGMTETEHLTDRIKILEEEKKRCESLYSSGIILSADKDKYELLQIALKIITREIKADDGIIVLTTADGRVDEIISYDPDTNAEKSTLDICRNVIENTQINLSGESREKEINEDFIIKKSSVTGLELRNLLCIPLIRNSKLLGVLYAARKDKNNKFKESELTFLISFSKQVVRSLSISIELTELRSSTFNFSARRMKELRKIFNCSSIVGSSGKLYDVLRLSSRVADTDVNVLLLGENGTGKDLLAETIHKNSKRKDSPFVSINCGAIPADLLESELFGYEKGAYTGAVCAKPGRLEAADSGTIFLDEIGEMPVNLQTKLLTVIQTKEIQRLGSVLPKKIDVRFIAATNKNINELISEGDFREDLYYRLKVIEITLPPLRDRKEDIEELAEHFLTKYSEENLFTFSDEVTGALEDYDWPGNIRELENVVQRCVVLAQSNIIAIGDLPDELVPDKKSFESDKGIRPLNEAEKEFRKNYIRKVLKQCASKSEAAEILGINRSHLHRLLSGLEIKD